MQPSSYAFLFLAASGFFSSVTAEAILAQSGQETAKEKEKPKTVGIQEASAKKTAVEWTALKNATDETRPKALVTYLEYHIASNALYEGQYDALKGLEPAHALVEKWISTAPTGVAAALSFRITCIRALRDIHGKQAPDDLKSTLVKLVEKKTEERVLRENAIFALAQFGDRRYSDNLISNFTKMTADKNFVQKATGYNGLANVHYQIRDYKPAVAAYKQFLGLLESRKITVPQGPQIYYYNAACSMALAGMTDDAFIHLKKALKSGKGLSRRMFMEDMDMASLRKDPRFAKLIAEYFGEAKDVKKDAKKAGAKTGGAGKQGKR